MIKCDAFGDDSTSGDGRYAIYSFVGFEPRDVPKALGVLQRAKVKFHVAPTERLHCRVLFSGHQRAKTGWSHLKPRQAIEVCKFLGVELLALRPLWAYGYVDLNVVRNLPSRGQMLAELPSADDDPGFSFSMAVGEKQAQRFAYVAAVTPFEERFGIDAVRLWVDRDSTKIDWMNRRGMAHMLSEIHPCSPDLPPEYSGMIEIADLFAYSAGRFLANDQRPGWTLFRSIHRRYRPVSSEMSFDPTLFGGSSNDA